MWITLWIMWKTEGENMKTISYGRQYIDQEDINAVVETLKSDYLTQGPKVSEFEQKLCNYCGCKYAVAFSNGNSACKISTMQGSCSV